MLLFLKCIRTHVHCHMIPGKCSDSPVPSRDKHPCLKTAKTCVACLEPGFIYLGTVSNTGVAVQYQARLVLKQSTCVCVSRDVFVFGGAEAIPEDSQYRLTPGAHRSADKMQCRKVSHLFPAPRGVSHTQLHPLPGLGRTPALSPMR